MVDKKGWLPPERRERFLREFAAKSSAEASSLRERLPALRAELKMTQGKQERDAVREEIRKGAARLAYLEAVPPFTAPDICSECPWPTSWHDTGVTFCLTTGAVLREPCSSWPVWRATGSRTRPLRRDAADENAGNACACAAAGRGHTFRSLG